ncbi:MAG: NUDIX hydrolase [Deltaproteobacteria bacterium]|nr:NUDIX hydrolase [Deltaproteobacteria bacterium]
MSVNNPWKTCSSTVVYRNDWIAVREDKVIRPDGKEGIYGVVETPIATGVLALTPEMHIYLVGQYRYPTEQYSWEIVEGGSRKGELPLEAAKRELEEEAGLRASEWIPLGGEIHLSNCISAERAHLFIARGLEEVARNPDPTEILTVQKVPFNRAYEMVRSGEIKDSMSVIGILLTNALIAEKQL